MLDLLATWMPEQRGFAGKGRAPLLEIVGSFDLEAGGEDVIARTLLVLGARAIAHVVADARRTTRAGASLHGVADIESGTFVLRHASVEARRGRRSRNLRRRMRPEGPVWDSDA